MKKIIALTALTAIAITGCASSQHDKAEHHGKPMHGEHHKHHKHHDGKHHKGDKEGKRFHGDKHDRKHGDKRGKMAHQHDEVKTAYQCDAQAGIQAIYQPDDDKAILNINAPSWKLANQTIEFKAASSASGMRFVNETNPTSPYAWHAKGTDGILSVKVNGKEHSLSCQEIKKQA